MGKGDAIFGSSFFGVYTFNHQTLLSFPLLDINVLTYLFGLQDELETPSKPETISIFVHYGGDIINDPKPRAEHDVVVTTYGVLTSTYKKVNYNLQLCLLPTKFMQPTNSCCCCCYYFYFTAFMNCDTGWRNQHFP